VRRAQNESAQKNNNRRLPKKASAVAFTSDSVYALVADRFGDVYCCSSTGDGGGTAGGTTGGTAGGGDAAPASNMSQVLAHLQASVTSVTPLPWPAGAPPPPGAERGLLATTDRDAKVRVSRLPADPTKVRVCFVFWGACFVCRSVRCVVRAHMRRHGKRPSSQTRQKTPNP
jgi:hypothetical protein